MSYDVNLLLEQVAVGNEKAFRQIYDKHRDKVFYLAWKLLGTDQEANDVVQEIFLKLWLNRSKLGQVEHFSAYLNTTVRNHVANQFRIKAIKEVYLSEVDAEESAEGITPFETLSLHQLEKSLHEAIDGLSPQQKKVFYLSRIEGLKHREIADKLQISPETVKKYLVDSLRSIRSELSKNGITLPLAILYGILF